LNSANLTDAKLNNANLNRAKLNYAELKNAELVNAKLIGANLTNAKLIGAKLSGAKLSGSDMVNFVNYDWIGLQAPITNELYITFLTDADLTDAVLTDADLTDADLQRANLTGANLTGANLTGANLTGANLTGANLTRTILTGAILTGAILTGAILTGANINEAILQANFVEPDNIINPNNFVNPYQIHQSFEPILKQKDKLIQLLSGNDNDNYDEYFSNDKSKFSPDIVRKLLILFNIDGNTNVTIENRGNKTKGTITNFLDKIIKKFQESPITLDSNIIGLNKIKYDITMKDLLIAIFKFSKRRTDTYKKNYIDFFIID